LLPALFVNFEPHELVDIVPRSESAKGFAPVLPNTPREV